MIEIGIGDTVHFVIPDGAVRAGACVCALVTGIPSPGTDALDLLLFPAGPNHDDFEVTPVENAMHGMWHARAECPNPHTVMLNVSPRSAVLQTPYSACPVNGWVECATPDQCATRCIYAQERP